MKHCTIYLICVIPFWLLVIRPVAAQKPVIYQLFVRLFGNENKTRKPFGSIAENGTGKFADVSGRCLDSLRSLHISHIWYTGVIAHGSTTPYPQSGIASDDPDIIKGRAGSPYAIRDYYDVDPDLAQDPQHRMAEFTDLVHRTHAHGIKVLIDFVPNHVSRSYHSQEQESLGADDDTSLAFSPENDFYYIPHSRFIVPVDQRYDSGIAGLPGLDFRYEESPAKATGNDVFSPRPSVDDWYETVKLNYGVDYQHSKKEYFAPVPPLWHKMQAILRFWASKGVDGFRCDMIEMVPPAFWKWVIHGLKTEFPRLVFIGEAYTPALYPAYLDAAGFDWLYDKVGMYDALKDFYTSDKGNAAVIDSLAVNLRSERFIRFLENHDEVRINTPYFTQKPLDALAAMAVVSAIGNNPVLLYAGQEVGEQAKGAEGFGTDDGKSSLFDYWGLPSIQQWRNGGRFDGVGLADSLQNLRNKYSRLLRIVTGSKAFVNGTYTLLSAVKRHPKQLYFTRKYKKESYLVLVNLDAARTVPFRIAAGKLGHNVGKMKVVFQSKDFKIVNNKESIAAEIAPMGAAILKY